MAANPVPKPPAVEHSSVANEPVVRSVRGVLELGHLMHRARWVLAWPAVPEEELQFLATGEIGTNAN